MDADHPGNGGLIACRSTIPPVEAEERYYAIIEQSALAAGLNRKRLRLSRGGSLLADNYEQVYLRAYTYVPEARAAIGRYMEFFNTVCPHSSVDVRTPDEAYFNQLPAMVLAA